MRNRHQFKVPLWIWIAVIILGVVLLAGMLLLDMQESQKREAALLQLQQEERERRTPNDENSINVLSASGFRTSELAGGQLVFSNDDFLNSYTRTSRYEFSTTVSVDLDNLELDGSKVYLLRFKMRANEEAAVVRVDFGEKYDFYVTTEWSEYYYPCISEEVLSVKWILQSDFQIIQMSDVEIYEYGADVNLQNLNCGTYLAEDLETTLSESTDWQVGSKNRDIQYLNGYVYLVGDSSLFIARENNDGTLSTCGYLTDLGEVRRIELYNDSMLAVASRLNGVYLVDISDKEHPSIISHYDTLEIANDVCFTDHYMIVAGRYFGVEIVDISDPNSPKFVSQISNAKECYRVAVYEKTLFVSCWATGEVELYDISTIDKPKMVGIAKVDGRCGEAFISENYMYVVTGYRAMNLYENVGQPGYGTGNGLTIYDISNRSNPKWISTVKADGSLFHTGFDDWSICVSNGVAYFTNSYGGLYIYDVTDASAPKRMKKITVPLYNGESGKYADMSKSEAYVFPYDCTSYINSPVTGVALGSGKVYFSCAYTTVHSLEFENAQAVMVDSGVEEEYLLADAEQTNRYKNVEYLLDDRNVYAIQEIDGYYYVGTDSGICVLDQSFQRVNTVDTDNAVRDIRTFDRFLFTAETTGMGIYQAERGIVTCIGYYNANSPDKNVSSLGITSDGKFAILQSSWTELEIVSLSDLTDPVQVDTFVNSNGEKITLNEIGGTGSLYYRNIVNGNVDGMIGVIGMSNSVWFKSLGDELQIVASYSNSLYREEGGTAALDTGEVLTVCQNGYKVYNPITVDGSTLSDVMTKKIQDIYMSGKATVSNDILVVCHEYKGLVWVVNIADINSPTLIGYYEISGNPDLCLITDKYILIPAKHSGLIKISR